MDLHTKKLEKIKTKGEQAPKQKAPASADPAEIGEKIKMTKMQTTQFKQIEKN